MPWEHIGGISSAVLTGIGSVLATVLYYRHKGGKQSATTKDAHLEKFYETLNEAMASQEKRHAEAFNQIHEEQREERAQWAAERTALNAKVDRLQEQAREGDKAMHRKELEVVELRGEVKVLTERLGNAASSTSTAPIGVIQVN